MKTFKDTEGGMHRAVMNDSSIKSAVKATIRKTRGEELIHKRNEKGFFYTEVSDKGKIHSVDTKITLLVTTNGNATIR